MAVIVMSTGCAGSSGKAGSTAVASIRPSTKTAGSISLKILSPDDGGKAPNPAKLRVQAAGVQVAQPSAQISGAAHFDAFRDIPPVAEGELVPSGTGIFHFTDSVDVPVTQGQHTIVVVLSNNAHVRIAGAPTAQVTFTVGQ
jgi:hypothetical protein